MKNRLTKEGLTIYFDKPKTPLSFRLNREETERILGKVNWREQKDYPEIVHLELTHKCNLNCDYCYAPKTGKDLDYEFWLNVLKQLAEFGVFQITFGGGEPTLWEDKGMYLGDLAKHAKDLGFRIGLTTNGASFVIGIFINNLDQISVSYHGHWEQTISALEDFRSNPSPELGINFLMMRRYLPYLDRMAEVAKFYDANLMLLSYKPINDKLNPQLQGEFVPYDEIISKAFELDLKGEIIVKLDGLTCNECFAGRRFCTIGANGDVYQCSFVREPLGNLRKESFAEIWRRRKVEKCPYLNLRDNILREEVKNDR